MTLLAEGNSLKDGSNVLAKIAPAHSNGSVCLEREAHMYVDQLSFLGNTHPKSRLTKLVTRPSAALQLIDIFNIDRENGDVLVLLLSHPGPNLLGRYFPQGRINDLLLPVHHSLNTADSAVNSSTFKESGSETEEMQKTLMSWISHLLFSMFGTSIDEPCTHCCIDLPLRLHIASSKFIKRTSLIEKVSSPLSPAYATDLVSHSH